MVGPPQLCNLGMAGKQESAATKNTLTRNFLHARVCLSFILGLLFGTYFVPGCAGYGVLTHEAIIDAAWKDSIVPLLLKRFPNATPEELLQAHAYVYGGAIIQDMGYYPLAANSSAI